MERDDLSLSDMAAEELAKPPGALDINQATRIEESFLRGMFARPPSWDRVCWMHPDRARFAHLWRYMLRSPLRTIVCGTLGVMLLLGQFGYAAWAEGHAAETVRDASGFVRLGLLFGGALLVFLAWPEDRHVDPCEVERAEQDRFKDRIAMLRWRRN